MAPEPFEPKISSLKWNASPCVPTAAPKTACATEDGSKSCTPAPCTDPGVGVAVGVPGLTASLAAAISAVGLLVTVPEFTVPGFTGGSAISVPAPPLMLVKDHALSV